MHQKTQIQDLGFSAEIINGELVSFKNNSHEFIHQKGNKGWRNSDDEMFPVIGPTSKNNFLVHTKKGDAILDQHGLLRELEYSLVSSNDNSVSFIKTYKKNSFVKNSKFPKKSDIEHLFWPYNFNFQKNFKIEKNRLKIEFIIESEKGMPFMLGYHPAFLLSNSGTETLQTTTAKITLKEVLEAGSNAYPVLNCTKIELKNIGKNNIEISTTGFNNLMLWTEVNNMICIEPITQYTSYVEQEYLNKHMQLSQGKNIFTVEIKVI